MLNVLQPLAQSIEDFVSDSIAQKNSCFRNCIAPINMEVKCHVFLELSTD